LRGTDQLGVGEEVVVGAVAVRPHPVGTLIPAWKVPQLRQARIGVDQDLVAAREIIVAHQRAARYIEEHVGFGHNIAELVERQAVDRAIGRARVPAPAQGGRQLGKGALQEAEAVLVGGAVRARFGVIRLEAAVLEVVDLESEPLQAKRVLAVVPGDAADGIRRDHSGHDCLHCSRVALPEPSP
jgi:hypothetical protein